MTRLALSALLAILALFGPTPQALAHTELVSSDPADGATLPQRPTQLTLTFTEPVPAESATVTLTGPDGSELPLGEVTAEAATLTIPLPETGAPAGRYTVKWLVESLDGDFVDGTFAFTAPAGAQPPATTAPPAAQTTAPTTTAATATTATTATTVITATAPPTVPGSEDGGGVPLWVWIVGAAVLAAIGIAVAVALGRRADADGKPAE